MSTSRRGTRVSVRAMVRGRAVRMLLAGAGLCLLLALHLVLEHPAESDGPLDGDGLSSISATVIADAGVAHVGVAHVGAHRAPAGPLDVHVLAGCALLMAFGLLFVGLVRGEVSARPRSAFLRSGQRRRGPPPGPQRLLLCVERV